MAAISMNRAGKTAVLAARAMVTVPSSSGWRSTSSDAPIELRHLVQEQDAVVGQADLAGPRDRRRRRPAPTSETVWCGARNGRSLQQADAGREQAADRVDRRALERLVEGERRQDAGHPPAPSSSCRRPGGPTIRRLWPPAAAISSARLASVCPRTSEKSGAAAGCAAIGGIVTARIADAGGVQGGDRVGETTRPGMTRRAARRRRLRPRCWRAAGWPRRPPCGRRPQSGRTPRVAWIAAVQRQFAEQDDVVHLPAFDDAGRGQDTEGDRQVERRARLADVGRRQVDRDAVRREFEAGIPDGAPHPVAALADARVGQSDHREGREAERHVHFHVDREGLDAEDRGAAEAGEHVRRRAAIRAPAARGRKKRSGNRRTGRPARAPKPRRN